MRSHLPFLPFLPALTTLALLGCGKAPSTASLSFPESALMSVPGTSGHVEVAVRSSPQPPIRGLSNFEFTITDMVGAPLSGLTLSVQPWMPTMGHGTSLTPTIKDVGGGVYQITNVYLFMPGEWQLRTTISGGVSDSVAPEFTIQ